MRKSISATAALALIALAQGAPGVATATPQNPSTGVVATLASIRSQAREIAAGRYKTAEELRDPARRIQYAWSQVAPSLIGHGSVLVEANLANSSIEALIADSQAPTKAQVDAKNVASTVADLSEVAREHAADPSLK